MGPALAAFMAHNKWKKTVMITSTDDVWFDSGLALRTQLQADGIQVLKPASFETGRFKLETLKEIKESGIRVVMLLVYDNDAMMIHRLAVAEGMMNAGWSWLILSGMAFCDQRHGFLGWLDLRPLLPSEGMQEFAQQVKDSSKSHFNISADSVDLTHAVTLYNAIMLYAHAATAVLSKGGDLDDGKSVTTAMRKTSFVGAGGSLVGVDEQGDQLGPYEIMNCVVAPDSEFRRVPVGMYNNTLQQYNAYKTAVRWPGNSTDVPVDHLTGTIARLACVPCAAGMYVCGAKYGCARIQCLQVVHSMHMIYRRAEIFMNVSLELAYDLCRRSGALDLAPSPFRLKKGIQIISILKSKNSENSNENSSLSAPSYTNAGIQ